ncbi:MAG: serine hydrolase [Bacteroidota bacterium]
MKKWLLSKLLVLLGLSSFAQIFQPENNSLLLNEPLAPSFPQVQLTPPAAGDVDPELAAVMQNMLDSLTDLFDANGLSAAMITPSGDVWKGTSGPNSLALGDTLSVDMQLGMGSVTKTFTGAAIMQLTEEGILSVDDTIGQWLPPYPNVDPAISIRQLLNHTSGIYNFTNGSSFQFFLNSNLDSVITPEYVLENFVPTPSFPPGTSWGYSNTNYLLLGLIIEAATGNDFATEIRTRLLEPNGHSTMSLHPDEMPTGEIAHLWLDLNGDGIPDDFTAAGNSLNGLFSMAWAAGAMLTTPEDLAHWVKNLMTGQVVQQGTLDEMMEFVPLSGGFGYGLSLMRVELGGTVWWGHNGSIGYLTNALYSPELDVSMVLISNAGPFDELDFVWLALVQTYLEYTLTDTDENIMTENDLLIYPNPVYDEFLIGFDLRKKSPIQITVTNQLGQVIHQMDFEMMGAGMNNVQITDCGNWPVGIYQVQLKGADWLVSEKIVKK